MIKKWLPKVIIAIIFLLVFELSENLLAHSFRNCVSDETAQYIKGKAEKEYLSISPFVVQTTCTLHLIDNHNGFFSLLGTLVIAIFTGTLWLSTEKLWAAGEKQIAAAQASAEAATLAIGADRAWIMFDQVETFPLENGSLDGVPFKNGLRIRIGWRNRGRSPAINGNIFIDFKIVDESDCDVMFNDDWSRKQPNTPVGPNELIWSPPRVIVGDEYAALLRNERVVVVFCAVRYQDIYITTYRFSRMCCKITRSGSVVDKQTGATSPAWTFQAHGAQNIVT